MAKVSKSFRYGNHDVTLETGEIARQASGAVVVSMGGTVVLVTAVAAPKAREGQLAITHVEPVEALDGATLVACRLETGRTHQIRIHLAEAGHPLVGEKVYVRDFRGELIPAARAMLHAAELGFQSPTDDRPMRFRDDPPADFQETLTRLRRR